MNILDLIFPKKCLECGEPGKYICKRCLKKVPPGGWRSKNDYSIFKYEGVVRKTIIALKYKFATDVAGELAKICVFELNSGFKIPRSVTLAPIPLHKKRENFRGFNQAELMGKEIAAEMGWRFTSDLLVRTRSTVPQVQLKGSGRRTNLRNVFSLNTKYQILNTNYVVFDDVITTGSTINEARKALANAGCKNIFSLTIAG